METGFATLKDVSEALGTDTLNALRLAATGIIAGAVKLGPDGDYRIPVASVAKYIGAGAPGLQLMPPHDGVWYSDEATPAGNAFAAAILAAADDQIPAAAPKPPAGQAVAVMLVQKSAKINAALQRPFSMVRFAGGSNDRIPTQALAYIVSKYQSMAKKQVADKALKEKSGKPLIVDLYRWYAEIIAKVTADFMAGAITFSHYYPGTDAAGLPTSVRVDFKVNHSTLFPQAMLVQALELAFRGGAEVSAPPALPTNKPDSNSMARAVAHAKARTK